MISFIQENLLNIIIIAILILIVGLIIKSLIKQKKNGGGCTGDCSSCHSSCSSTSKKQYVKTTLEIDGMMCTMCESHINEAIRNAFKVKKVKSSHTSGKTVILSEHRLDEELLKKTIADTGYELKSISFELA